MNEAIDLGRLKEPFPSADIEWRIGQSGVGSNGVYAMVLAYITGRAILDRLDDVCGAENWQVNYRHSSGSKPGVFAAIGIRLDGEWVWKEDGSDESDIEAFKGGISGALKRAGSAWGVGRYLYKLSDNWAQVSTEKKPGWHYAKAANNTPAFYWQAPELPTWALPALEAQWRETPKGKATAERLKERLGGSGKEVAASNLVDEPTVAQIFALAKRIFGDDGKAFMAVLKTYHVKGVRDLSAIQAEAIIANLESMLSTAVA